jgi:hypothetical protein
MHLYVHPKIMRIFKARSESNWRPYHRLLMLCASLALFTQVSAQLQTHSPFVFIYRLHASDIKLFQKNQNSQKHMMRLLHTKVDSFPYRGEYKKQLPNGYYLLAYTTNNNVQISLHLKTSFSAEIKNRNASNVLVLFDTKTGKSLTGLKVFLKKDQLNYDAENGGFLLPGKRSKGEVFVVDNTDTAYFELERKLNKKPYNTNEHGTWEGYIAFSKPRYLPGDTVKIKPYLLRKKKPYNEKLWVAVSYYDNATYETKRVFLKKISPVRAGAYEVSFVCGDSLKIDQDYKVKLFRNSKKPPGEWSEVLEESFYLEDYQLDEVTYTAEPAKENFSGSDSVEFILSAKDPNGLDIIDAKAEVKISTAGILPSSSQATEIPYFVLTKEIPMVPGGETNFKIPLTAFPLINAKYFAEIKFTNSNKETKILTIDFSVSKDLGNLRFTDKDDSVLIEEIIAPNGKKEAKIITTGNGIVLSETKQTLPVLIRLNSYLNEIRVEYEGKLFNWSVYNDKIEFSGIRQKDSVFAYLKNPRALPVDYEILKDKIVVQKGKTSGPKEFKLADSSRAEYVFRYLYTWNSNARTGERNILAPEKTLSVQLATPAAVSPGQEAEIKITVKDFNGKNVQDANICAAAVNSQFGSVNIPSLPDYNKVKKVKKKEYVLNDLSDRYVSNPWFKIDTNWINTFKLDTLHYYKIQFPGKEFYKKQLAISTENAQFAPFLSDKGKFVTINLIYIDDSLVYASGIQFEKYLQYARSAGMSAWSFASKPGMHTVKVRTTDAEYTIENIWLKRGYKLEFGFDVEQLPPNVKKKKASRTISKAESDKIFSKLFVIEYAYGYNQNYYFQDSAFFPFSTRSYCLLDPAKPVYYGMNYSYNEAKGTVRFKAGHIFEFSSRGVKDSVLKSLPTKFQKKNGSEDYPIGRQILTPPKGFLSAFISTQLRPDPWYNEFKRYRYQETADPHTLAKATDKGYGTLQIDITDTLETGLVLLTGINGDTAWYHPCPNSFPAVMYNITPGSYDLLISGSGGKHISRKKITIKADTLVFLQFGRKDILGAEDFVPKNFSSGSLSISYAGTGGTISGSITSADRSGEQPAMVILFRNQEILQVEFVKPNGTFNFRDLEPGFYQLYFKSAGEKEKCLIQPVFVSQKYSALLKIHAEKQSMFELLVDGKEYEKINPYKFNSNSLPLLWNENQNLRGATLFGKNTALALYNDRGYFGRINPRQSYQVDDKTLYFDDYRRYRRRRGFFGKRRHVSSFYRSRYSMRRTRSKFGGSDGSDDGRFEEVNVVSKVVRGGSWKDAEYYLESGNAELSGKKMELNEVQLAGFLNNVPGVMSSEYADSTAAGFVSNGPQLRTKFTDNAFWKPNLFTNEKGEVVFKVRYPDNITQWNNWAVAMGEGQKSGRMHTQTKAFKTIMATLSVPRFFVEGDSSSSIGKTLNYSGADIKAKTWFKLNQKTLFEKTETVTKGKTESLSFRIPSVEADSIKLEYGLQTDKGISDGEQREVPVYKQGVELADGEFFVLQQDTTITIKAKEKGAAYEISCVDNDLDVLLEQLKKIIDYRYECNEQLASKLKALVLERAVRDTLNDHFKGNAELRRIIKRLAKYQNVDGSWGWWSGSKPNFFISAYILDAIGELEDAKQIDRVKGLAWITKMYNSLSADEKIYALQVLSKNKYKGLSYPEEIRLIEKSKTLTFYDKVRVARIKQEQGLTRSDEIQYILANKKQSLFGGLYWGEDGNHVRDNYSTITALVYRILKDEGKYDSELNKVRLFFMEKSNANIWRNTVESASILQNILPDVLKDYKNPRKSIEMKFTGDFTSTVKAFPLQAKAKSEGKDLVLTKKGTGPAYFSVYTRKWITKPLAISEYFEMKTTFEKNKQEIKTLRAGEVTILKVTVTVKKKCDYVMLEVPIPAGCSYHSKPQEEGYSEAYREYYKEKTNIYCETLPPGTYTYEIELEPRFTGEYYLNPAKAELMYFPVFKGINEGRRVAISESGNSE